MQERNYITQKSVSDQAVIVDPIRDRQGDVSCVPHCWVGFPVSPATFFFKAEASVLTGFSRPAALQHLAEKHCKKRTATSAPCRTWKSVPVSPWEGISRRLSWLRSAHGLPLAVLTLMDLAQVSAACPGSLPTAAPTFIVWRPVLQV